MSLLKNIKSFNLFLVVFCGTILCAPEEITNPPTYDYDYYQVKGDSFMYQGTKTFKGDFVYNFKKQSLVKRQKLNGVAPVEHLKKEIQKNIKKNKGFITPDKLYEKIIPFIVNNNLYRDQNNKIIDVENLLNKNFKYKKRIKNSKINYGWIL